MREIHVAHTFKGRACAYKDRLRSLMHLYRLHLYHLNKQASFRKGFSLREEIY